MKNNALSSLAILATTCLSQQAAAQTSITLFGVMDAAVSGFSNKSEDLNGPTAANPTYVNRGTTRVGNTQLRHSGTTTSRLGFKGTEDLGGGLSAGFWLEAPITNDDGNPAGLQFLRRSTVSLSGPFGEFRLGRDYTPTFWNDSIFDPWAQIGAGAALMLAAGNSTPGNGFIANPNYARASNGIGYFLPPGLGGFYGQLMYTFHENTSYGSSQTPPGVSASGVLNPGPVAPSRAGRYVGGRFGYVRGAIDTAVAYGRSTLADNFYAGTTDAVDIMSVGGSYDFGLLKLSASMSRWRYFRDYEVMPSAGVVPDVDVSNYLIAATAPVGVGLLRAAYSQIRYDRNVSAVAPFTGDPRARKLALGYVHNLSKRTALYVNVARVSNENGASLTVNGAPGFINNATATPKTSTGYDLGLRHIF